MIITVPKHIYLLKVDNEWAHFINCKQGDDFNFYGDKTLTEVYKVIKEKYPDRKLRVLHDENLEDYLRTCKEDEQLRIFNEVQSMSKRLARE